jgi:hypothetical protein
MHCYDGLLVSYSSYIFRRMYVIIRERGAVTKQIDTHSVSIRQSQ